MKKVRLITAPFTALILFGAMGLHATDIDQTWNINTLLQTKSDIVFLRNQKREVIKSIEIEQLRTISNAMSDIESAAEHKALLSLVKGDQPNASAGKIKNRETVLINFAMLDLYKNKESAVTRFRKCKTRLRCGSRQHPNKLRYDASYIPVAFIFCGGPTSQLAPILVK